MLLSMVPELRKQFEDMEAYDIIIQLIAMFDKTARVERFETILESLGVPLGNKLATDIILYTLHKGMLKTAKKSIKGEPMKNVLMVQKKKNDFKKGGNKNKKKASGKQGHWKRNCPKYLKDLKNGSVASTSGTKRSRELGKGEVDLHVGNGAQVVALAVGNYVLSLPSGLTLELNNYYYVPTSRFQSFPGNDDWTAIKNILKYLKQTKDYFLTYGGDYELCVKGYTNASLQIENDDYRS
ncbi:hypothetical protein Sango_2811600 [Sesamum angolense]|uniref:Gag/pol protein n=1 Tax=Sesamum angolense TaxID=2727404 RepID=A0AAE1VWS0_9LAMI|nr:hypothetical protein Sango_2811600 [Sesamum angolense]